MTCCGGAAACARSRGSTAGRRSARCRWLARMARDVARRGQPQPVAKAGRSAQAQRLRPQPGQQTRAARRRCRHRLGQSSSVRPASSLASPAKAARCGDPAGASTASRLAPSASRRVSHSSEIAVLDDGGGVRRLTRKIRNKGRSGCDIRSGHEPSTGCRPAWPARRPSLAPSRRRRLRRPCGARPDRPASWPRRGATRRGAPGWRERRACRR